MMAAPAISDWDFALVDESEIRDCCLYEYCREAEFALWVALRNAEVERVNAIKEGSMPGRIVGQGPRFQWLVMGERADEYEDPFSTPPSWAALNSEQKPVVMQALAIVRRSSLEIPGKKSPTDALMPIPAQALLSWVTKDDAFFPDVPAIGRGRVWMAREVNLREFTDREIQSEFAAWLKVARAETGCTEPPDGKGKRLSSDKANLAKLSLMRLFATLPKSEICSTVAAGDYVELRDLLFGAPRAGEVLSEAEALARARDEFRADAREYFRRLFPELGLAAEPASWLRFTERLSLPPLK